MAERCPRCKDRISKIDLVIECPNCKKQYHKWCWGMTKFCHECGYINVYASSNLTEEERALIEAQQRQEIDTKRLNEEKARQKAEQEKYQARINHLKATGRDGYYEYKVISLVDKKGAVDTERLMAELNDLGLDGWRLQCAYTNEMGKDALSIAGFGINATADQNILIFERFVKFE